MPTNNSKLLPGVLQKTPVRVTACKEELISNYKPAKDPEEQ
jgi:hypothetical protein